MTDNNESESDENMTEDDSSEQTSAEVPFVCDDVHEQAYSELEDAGVNVEQALADRLHQAFENELYQMRQEFKYGSGGRQ